MRKRLSVIFGGRPTTSGRGLAAALVVLFFGLTVPVPGAEKQTVRGHVPLAVTRLNLQPVGRLPAADHLHLDIMLPPRNGGALGELLQQLHDPASTNFHRYLTPEQYNERFAPTEADYDAAIRFARAHGLTVTGTVPGRTIVEVDGAVVDIEKALRVTLRSYEHPSEARRFFAPDVEPSLDLEAAVVAISGLDNYVLPHSRVRVRDQKGVAGRNADSGFPAKAGSIGTHDGSGSFTNWENLFMGSDFRHAFVPDTGLEGSGQSVGVMEWNSFTPADIATYKSTAGLPDVPVVEVEVGAGTIRNINNGDGEVPLDIDMVISMAPGVAKVIVYHGGGYDAMLTEAADPTQGEGRPLQIGCSICTGSDNNTSNCLARLAAQGQSFFYASGDNGAWPVEPSGPGGSYVNGQFSTDTQPYMVQVGGTELVMNGHGTSWKAETVWGGSAGGYQTPLAIPPFQRWINLGAIGGSASYRNVPDVAMPADNILVFCTDTNGSQGTYNTSGTSCAAPLWAGFAALVNQQAASQGQPSIGYANPALYAIAQASYASCFHDMVVGNNTNSSSPTRYYAASGFDLCTGWGSPRGWNLINALAGFGGPVFVDFNYTGPASNGSYDGPGSYGYPFKTLAAGVAGVSSGGTIFIKTAGTSAETMTISKPMTITASDGAATVGH